MRFASYSDNRDVTTQELQELFDILCSLREGTDPKFGPQSEDGKDDRALRAAFMAGLLAVGLAGWAYNHLAGRAVQADLKQDSHEHERLGQTILLKDIASVSSRYRRALVALVEAQSNLFPTLAAKSLADALLALELGEVQPILAPKMTGKHGNAFTLWHHRLDAVCRWRYLVGQGVRSGVALARVADAFGCAAATVRSWEGRLPKELGSKLVECSLDRAQRAGELAAKISSLPEDEPIDGMAAHFHDVYTRTSLRTAGLTYRNAQIHSRQ